MTVAELEKASRKRASAYRSSGARGVMSRRQGRRRLSRAGGCVGGVWGRGRSVSGGFSVTVAELEGFGREHVTPVEVLA